MAVQQNKKSPSKRGMHRSHDFLTSPSLAVEPTTGEVHLRHHISPTRLLPRQEGRQDQGRISRHRRRRPTRWEEGRGYPARRSDRTPALTGRSLS